MKYLKVYVTRAHASCLGKCSASVHFVIAETVSSRACPCARCWKADYVYSYAWHHFLKSSACKHYIVVRRTRTSVSFDNPLATDHNGRYVITTALKLVHQYAYNWLRKNRCKWNAAKILFLPNLRVPSVTGHHRCRWYEKGIDQKRWFFGDH